MNNSVIRGSVDSWGKISSGTPKQIELFDQKLNKIKSKWIFRNDFSFDNLISGIYVVRLQLASGLQQDIVVNTNEESGYVRFNIGNFISQDFRTPASYDLNIPTRRFKHLSKYKADNLIPSTDSRSLSFFHWVSSPVDEIPILENSGLINAHDLQRDGISIILETDDCTNYIEISGKGTSKYVVFLPPGQQIKIVVQKKRNAETWDPLKITVITANLKSEALLALMRTGAIEDASSLTNASDAENLLLEKRHDAAAAAVGGYFLLKTGELHRMHNWANNLANWFPWMSDGLVIHAWQMIQSENRQELLPEIKNRLIKAAMGVLPVYTEGMKLLTEGLNQIASLSNPNDATVNIAREKINALKGRVDWSQVTTTLILSDGDNYNIFSGRI